MIYFFDLFGTAVFAISGALIAAKKKMDLFGMVVVGIVTALGGGTLRDIILNQPVFWINDQLYILVGIVSSLLVFFLPHIWKTEAIPFLFADAFGLALFTVLGAQKAYTLGAPFLIVIIMGTFTGVAGGVIRDLLCNKIPMILHKEIYATASIAGGTVFMIISWIYPGKNFAFIPSAIIVLLIRLSAIRWKLSLPVLNHK